MGRKSIRTEVRARENLEVLSNYVDENGISSYDARGEAYKTPSVILAEYRGYGAYTSSYPDLKMLEETGRLAYYPPEASNYTKGFRINRVVQAVLEAALKEELDTRLETVKNSLKDSAQELESIIYDRGWLADQEAPSD